MIDCSYIEARDIKDLNEEQFLDLTKKVSGGVYIAPSARNILCERDWWRDVPIQLHEIEKMDKNSFTRFMDFPEEKNRTFSFEAIQFAQKNCWISESESLDIEDFAQLAIA